MIEKDISKVKDGISYILSVRIILDCNSLGNQHQIILYKNFDDAKKEFDKQRETCIEKNKDREGYTFKITEDEEDFFNAKVTDENNRNYYVVIELGILKEKTAYDLAIYNIGI